MKKNPKITLSEQMVQIMNQILWSEMLSPTCTLHKPIIGFEKALSKLSKSGVEIVFLDGGKAVSCQITGHFHS